MHALPKSVSSPVRPAGVPLGGKLAWTVVGAALGAALAAALAWSGVWPRTPPSESHPLRVSIVHTEGSEVAAPAISPDGRRVAYRARRGDGMPLLWVRDLASGESQSLRGHRGRHHALLVAGLARPRVLRRRGVETRVGRRVDRFGS